MSIPKPHWLKVAALFAVLALVLTACTGDDDDANGGASNGESTWDGAITFGDFNWDSAIFHNRVAQFIVEHGYGYETDTIGATTLPMLQGLRDNDVQIVMEMWIENMPESYHEEVEEGVFIDHGANYSESIQGWFVPTFMIEGDDERGIEPVAPDLRHVDDLPEYYHLFEDDEDPSKGRIYHGVGGWEAFEISQAKATAYGLDDYFNGFDPGSEAALFTSVQAAYDRGEPWIGYLWAPSWVFAQLDLTQIEEPEYTEECWENIQDGVEGCAFPSVRVHIVTNPEIVEGAPEVIEFLENYTSTMDETSEVLLYIADNDSTTDEAAIWWLENNEDTWSDWVPEDVAESVRDALNGNN
jgi:glycine betaine/proline transport system substrate-binding protein